MIPVVYLASAAGNVFGYLWSDELSTFFDGPSWARALCPKGRGLGLDGIFLLHREGQSLVSMEHWDPDGAYTFCSNGSRAALAWIPSMTEPFLELSSSGVIVQLRRGTSGVGLRMPEGDPYRLRTMEIETGVPSSFAWIGNPQLLLEYRDVASLDLKMLAPPLRHHPAFPEGTNVNVLEILELGLARIRSWERGVEGETQCCGTGCAAAGAWLAQRTGRLEWIFLTAGGDKVSVNLDRLEEGAWNNLWLEGPVRKIAQIHLEASNFPELCRLP